MCLGATKPVQLKKLTRRNKEPSRHEKDQAQPNSGYHMTSLTSGIQKEMARVNLQNTERFTGLENELVVEGQWGAGGRDGLGLWEGRVHTAICKMDDQQRPIL